MKFSGGAIAQNWSRWEREFRRIFAACELGQKPNETQVAILFQTAGPEAQEINKTLVYANDDEKKDYNSDLGKLRAYCEPRKNVVFERHRFWSRDQLEHETIGQWTTELRTKAANCEFQESDNMIRDQIEFGIKYRPVQEKLLREYDLTLEKALDICRASETSKEQYRAMSSQHQQDIAVHDIRAGEREDRTRSVSEESFPNTV